MNMETLEKIKKMLSTAASLRGFHGSYLKTTSAESCDKHGFGFGQDNRFSNFSVKTSFASWKGYYGNSGCTSFDVGNREILEVYFIQALNKHWKLLFETTANLIEKDATELRSKAEAEIEAARTLLSTLVDDEDNEAILEEERLQDEQDNSQFGVGA